MDWLGVPRKSDELLTGYQRFLDPSRINQQIVPFFQNPRNSSPTAIIVALRRDSGLGKCTLENSDVPAGRVVPTKLNIEIDNTALDSDDVFVSALEYVNDRLVMNPTVSPKADEDIDSGEDED